MVKKSKHNFLFFFGLLIIHLIETNAQNLRGTYSSTSHSSIGKYGANLNYDQKACIEGMNSERYAGCMDYFTTSKVTVDEDFCGFYKGALSCLPKECKDSPTEKENRYRANLACGKGHAQASALLSGRKEDIKVMQANPRLRKVKAYPMPS